jgi:hypothetical protein
MTQATVKQILDLIEQLPDPEREALDQQLAERAETAWRREAEQARREAETRGIDQTAIDEAIRRRPSAS